MKQNIIEEKTIKFSLEIIDTYKFLKDNLKEYDLARQILRSGTSIGANIQEAINGSSKRDFISKVNISYKEANETKYWLFLLSESKIYKNEKLYSECIEIIKILTKILKTSRESLKS